MKLFTPNRFLVRNFSLICSLLIVLFFSVGKGWGQNASTYTFSQTNNTYVALTSPTVLGSGSLLDDVTYTISSGSLSGFTFNFAGTNYTAFTVSSNGYIGFGSSLMSTTNDHPLSTSTGGNAFVAAYADDLGGLNANTQISWKLVGSSPNRELVVEYKNVRNLSRAGCDLSFQVRLLETTNIVSIVYGTMIYTSTTTDDSQVGIKSSTSTGHFSNRSTSTNWNSTINGTSNTSTCTVLNTITMPVSGLTFSWAPPSPCSGTPTAGSITSNTTQNICSGTTPSPLTVTGTTTGVTGITYQWEQSTDNSTWVNASGGTGSTTSSYTPPSFGGTTIYYRCKVTCASSALFDVTNTATISPPANPTNQVSNLTFSSVDYTSMTASWTNGNGNRRVVYISNSAIVDPTNNTGASAFTANTTYSGSGQQIVFDGTGTTVSITGLSIGTSYYVKVIEYNRCGSSTFDNYFNLSSGTNSNTQNTIGASATPWSQGFSTTTLPINWSGSSWSISNSITALNPSLSSNYIYVNLDGSPSTASLIQPIIGVIPANYRFSVKYKLANFGGTGTPPATGSGNFVVAISTNNGTSYTDVQTVANNNISGWQDYLLNLSAYVGQNIRIRITGNYTSGDYYLAFDDFSVEAIPTCFIPTVLASSAVTNNSATIGWTAPSSGTSPVSYDYEVRTSGAAGSGSTGLVASGTESSNSASISNLTSATIYYFYVKSNCGGGDVSSWTNSGTFTTSCDAPNNPGTISVSNASSSGFTLTYAAASPVPTSYVLFNTTGTSTAATTLPSLTNGTTYAGSTAYTIGGTSYNCITASSASPQSLTGGVSNTQYNYFLFSRNATNSCSGAPYFSSGVMVSAVTCAAAPTSPSTAGVTTNGATISWTASDAGGGYGTINYSLEVYTDAGYTTPISGSPFSMGTVVTQSLTGLSSATTYYYRIVASNGVCNSTYLTGSFSTLCLPITSLPWTEGFEGLSTVGTTSFPTCWLEGTGTNWNSLNTAASSYNDPRTGSKYVGCFYSAASNARLWTPGFQLTAGVSYDFSTYFVGDGYSGWTAEIVYNTSTLATGETTLGAQFITGSSTSTSGTTYTQIKRTFIPSTTGEYYFGIKVSATSAPWGYLGFDDFTLELTPTCFVPTTLVASSITSNGATLGWTAPSTGTSPSNYNYEVRTSGAAGSGSTGLVTSATVSSNSALISGLIPSTTYSIYVRSSCGNGDYSVWSTTYSFTTACAPISVFPSTENFTTYLPSSCWVEATNGNQSSGPNNIPASSLWTAAGYLNNGSTGAAKINIYTTGKNEWIITPSYSIPMSDYRVKFDVGATQYNTTSAPTTAWESDDFVQMLVNVNGSTSWTILKTYNNTNVPSYLGQTDMFSLSSYAGQTVQFAFRAKEGSQDGSADIDFFIDNFTVEATPISTWTGTTNANWATASNWSNSTLPAETNVIIIPSNVPNFPDASSITIGSSGSLSLQSNAQLTISGTLTNNGTLTLESGATLVQGSSSTLAGSGTYNVKQAITGDGTTTPSGRFWYLGSPVSLASSSVYFASNAANVVKKRSESTNAWTALSSGTAEDLFVGQGYYTQAMGNATINFTGGLLNNGAISITNLTRTAGQGFEGFNLVSNPYPSYLDWDAVTKTDVGNTMWYRTHNGTAMVFDTYVAGTGGIGTNLNGNGVSNLIPPMQSFWVRVNSGSSTGSLAVNNTMRSHFTSINGSVAGLKSTANERDLFLRMNLLQANKKDQLIVYVNEQATNGFDILDGEKMMQAGFPQFYTKAGDKKIVINGLNSAKKQQALPVTIELPTTGVHTFVIEDLEISNGLVWLEDKQEEIIQTLEPGTVYEFYAASGLNADRFVLHFQLIDDAVPTNVYNEVNSSANFSGKGASVYAESAGVVVIKLPASAEGVTDIQIRDAAGKLVYAGSMNNLETSVELAQANGIYYVTLSSNTGVEVRKVFIQQ